MQNIQTAVHDGRLSRVHSPDIARLLNTSIKAMRDSASAAPRLFGRHSALMSLGRLVHAEEGRFLEAVLRQTLASEKRFQLVEKPVALPVYDDALSLVERNELARLEGLAVDPNRRARLTYRPDIIAVDRETHTAFVLDAKRSLESWSGSASLEKLASRMLAASLTLPDLLYREHQRLYVRHTTIAIIDLGETRDRYPTGVFPVSAVDDVLGLTGLGDAMAEARREFREAVQRLIGDLVPDVGSTRPDRTRRPDEPLAFESDQSIGADRFQAADPPGRDALRPTFGIATPAIRHA